MKKLASALIVLSFVGLFASKSLAQLTPTNPPARVTVAWDATTDPSVTAYKVYWGANTRFYTNFVTVAAPNTQVTISNLVRGTMYYIAATSVATNGLESEFSNEVTYRPPLPPTAPVIRLSISGSGKRITGIGEPWGTYQVERKVKMADEWSEVGTTEADGEGKILHVDIMPPPVSALYRVKQM